MVLFYNRNCNVVSREIDPTDGTQKFILVGIVNGNPRGCRNQREYPDYHVSVGSKEVSSSLAFKSRTEADVCIKHQVYFLTFSDPEMDQKHNCNSSRSRWILYNNNYSNNNNAYNNNITNNYYHTD